MEGILYQGNRKGNFFVEVRVNAAWQGQMSANCLENCFLTFGCHINGHLKCKRQRQLCDSEELTPGPALP